MDAQDLRIQRFLAQAGVGSRRTCDDFVAQGRVTVNGTVATLGTRVRPTEDVVELDGSRIGLPAEPVVYMLHKPAGVVSTMADERGRPCVGDLVRGHPERLFHVGRLDEATEGLLLLTNDGDLAQLLMHPSHGVSKTYVATVRGVVTARSLRRLEDGVDLEDGLARADSAVLRGVLGGRSSVLEVVLHEGRKRIVRRMLKAVGHPVERLQRVAIGALELADLPSGSMRQLAASEVAELRKAASK